MLHLSKETTAQMVDLESYAYNYNSFYSSTYAFAFGGYTTQSKIKIVTPFETCREILIKYLIDKHKEQKYPICGTEFRLFISKRHNVNTTEKKFYEYTEQDNHKIQAVENVLNVLEKEFKFDGLSKVSKLNSDLLYNLYNQTNLYMLCGPWNWICMPQMISLALLIVKSIINDNTHKWCLFKGSDDFIDCVGIEYDETIKYWKHFFKNHHNLLLGRSPRKVFLKSESYHGIYNLLVTQYADRKTLNNWKKIVQSIH